MEEKGDKGTDLEFLEFLTLIPATFPLLFHLLESDQTFSSPFRTGTATTLHGGEGSGGRKSSMPITEENRAEGAIAQCLDRSIRAWRACEGEKRMNGGKREADGDVLEEASPTMSFPLCTVAAGMPMTWTGSFGWDGGLEGG